MVDKIDEIILLRALIRIIHQPRDYGHEFDRIKKIAQTAVAQYQRKAGMEPQYREYSDEEIG